MEIKRGIGVSPGVVIAEAFILDSEEVRIPRRYRLDNVPPDEDVARFETAKANSILEIEALKNRIPDDVHREHAAMIFDTHQLILKDPVLASDILRRIREERHTAEYAVTRTFRHYKKLVRDLDGPMFLNRVTDFADIERRLLVNLLGAEREYITSLHQEVILVSHDLSPSQTAGLDREHVIGLALDAGGPTSHTAILARAMSLPTVVGFGDSISNDIAGGDLLILDGTRGILIINPDEGTRGRYEARRQAAREQRDRMIAEIKSLPCQTADGERIQMHANIEFVGEIGEALKMGAEGVGLFRTEFIFAAASGQPEETEHFDAYCRSLAMLEGRTLTIRTMDFGADKFSRELGLPHEPNPAMGCRSIRLSLRHDHLFRTQLRAILRAALHGDVRVMFPMISTLDELHRAKQMIAETHEELAREGIAHRESVPVGMMVEVPSVALTIEEFLPAVDFVAIGTNDLIQYTLAADRTNPTVAPLYQPGHPAVRFLLDRVIKAAAEAGVECSICGEMASDVRYTQMLINLGLRNFSVTPSAIPPIKRAIRAASVGDNTPSQRNKQPATPAT